jgi:hypothetical protein
MQQVVRKARLRREIRDESEEKAILFLLNTFLPFSTTSCPPTLKQTNNQKKLLEEGSHNICT